MSVFGDYANFYDTLYKDKDYAAETDYVVSLLKRFAPKATDLLEFGSGTGIHGKMLARKGFNVHGIERSPAMAERARLTIESAKEPDTFTGAFDFTLGDIGSTQLHRTFDAVIALFHVISYQTDDESLFAAFSNAYRHLKSDGVFLFDIWYTPAVLSERPEVRVKRVSDDILQITRLAEPTMRVNENIVEIHYTLFVENRASGKFTQLGEDHFMRHFSLTEIRLLAKQTGFALVHSEEFLTAALPSETTWGVCFVLKKK